MFHSLSQCTYIGNIHSFFCGAENKHSGGPSTVSVKHEGICSNGLSYPNFDVILQNRCHRRQTLRITSLRYLFSSLLISVIKWIIYQSPSSIKLQAIYSIVISHSTRLTNRRKTGRESEEREKEERKKWEQWQCTVHIPRFASMNTKTSCESLSGGKQYRVGWRETEMDIREWER